MAFQQRVEDNFTASPVSKRRYAITGEKYLGTKYKYNADKEQFEQSYPENIGLERLSLLTGGEYEIHFANRSKIKTAITSDGWKLERFGVRLPPIKMPPEEARKFSDSTGTTLLNMLYVFKIAPLPPTFVHPAFAQTQNRYISFTAGYSQQWKIGASLEEVWIYDERDGRIFRKTHINGKP